MENNQPWFGFADADHQADELEPLVRTLRYALIDLQKFWIEVQSIPVFMNGLKVCSMEEIERIFQWVLSTPDWNEKIDHPRLVPEIADAATRKKILEFSRSVLCSRALIDELQSGIASPARDTAGLEKLWGQLSEARAICERQSAGPLKSTDVEEKKRKATIAWQKVRALQEFFARVTEKTGAPLAADAHEAECVLKALECIQKMPEKIRPWRTRQILDPSQKIRLQIWRDRARPTLELRRRLETFFNLEADVSVGELKTLAQALKAEGVFAQFKTPYREALAKYRGLLRDRVALKVDGKNTGFQKAAKLEEWILLTEQTEAFSRQAEAKQAFAPHFQGVDTDFDSAIEANAWSQTLRDELMFESAFFEFVTQIPVERISLASSLVQDPECEAVRTLLSDEELKQGGSFARLEAERKKCSLDFKRLQEIVTAIGLESKIPFSGLQEIAERVEETFFLLRRIESDTELRNSLKEAYAGIETDLSVIEPCAAYVKAVRTAQLPESVEVSLLTVYGPQRLSDARELVQRCLTSMAVVREHYRKLELATRDQVKAVSHGKALEAAAVVDLMDRIQRALKEAQHLAECVAELRRRRDSQRTGLSRRAESSPSGLPQSV